jgi:lipopolysaccharide/colanic/teichoic acid biosynthesis glycosyltransferase
MVALMIQVALITIGATILEIPIPRTILLAVPLLEAGLLPLWRSVRRALWPVRPRETILVGNPKEIMAALGALQDTRDARVRVVAHAGSGPAVASIPWIGPLDDPAVRMALRKADDVIYVASEAGGNSRLELLRIRGPRGYLLLASPADSLLVSSVLGWMGDEPLIEIVVGCGYGLRAIAKRAIDLTLGTLLVALALPFFALVAALVWLEDRGPVFLRQRRLGQGCVPFEMWKFRSMRAPRTDGADQSDRARTTRVGRLLRRYRIDELPQLFNVIAGDMSLVGPRPERPEIAERITSGLPDFDLRCMIRPGIAGLAQIRAEYDSRPEVKLRYDLTYMCSWSLWLDMRLLVSSVAVALSGSGV